MGYAIQVFKIRKEKFWKFFDLVKTFYHELFSKCFNEGETKGGSFDDKIVNQVVRIGDAIFSFQFQLFDNGDFWIVMPLGRFFWRDFNKTETWKKRVDEVLITQNKADQTAEDHRNEWLVKWLDSLRKKRHYFLVKVFDGEDAFSLYWNYSMEQRKKI